MVLETTPRNWYRDEYLISTEPLLIQIDAVNAAMSSDLMWWAKGLPRDEAKRALHNSLCLGVYVLPKSTSEIAGQGTPVQIGLVRMVTDDVTFAYLTDVYLLPEYQGKGLGSWMMECLNEVIKGWNHLRRFMLLTSDKMYLYRKYLGVRDWNECNTTGINIGLIEGPASSHPKHS
ncbi:uncharacterized protein F4807DRAFT_38073 [Annulohypoxylon truncatum]|uniref:uncharacterized protein n=1 Tax=Annulohypoxylon truncatum TaxID=327061 RepID=UPI002007FC53|nr:uncharacterized protein F4807DRAFT_38073 [Annulohypoxylon truncatum]KAI1211419.1 hypothetical protein F4807DRAFT_38073 [Annulohypoxylon truncatum]